MGCIGCLSAISNRMRIGWPTLLLDMLGNVHDEINWMEDSPPLVVEAMYYDPIIFQWMNACSGFKYIHEDQKHV